MTGAFRVPAPTNEPVRSYGPGSPERAALTDRLAVMAKERLEAPMVIGGRPVAGASTFTVTAPHRHSHVLADVQAAGPEHVSAAIEAALEARA
ncbi:MAG: 1-pyrroline-5-carboxylate dehydrogenase, partial [Actinomycetota bacterium]|nr:1-pyrroline-5-carboxylate dehydrogenase [Actinomycetota bacterium]